MEKSGNGLRVDIKSIQTKREVDIESTMASSQGTDQQEQPLSPVSQLFHEPKSNLHIILLLGIKGRINPDVVKAEAMHTWLKHPRFSSVQVVDKKNGNEMKWVRTKVDLDKHIIVPSFHPNMDSSPDKFVEDYVSNLSKTTMDMSRPLWELHLLNVKTSSHADAVEIFRIHHSLGDATSLMSFLLASTRKVSNHDALPTLPAVKKSNSKNSKGFWATFWLVWNTFIDVLMLAWMTLFLNDTQTPMSTPAGVGPTPWRFVHRTVSLDDIKLVKNAMNATINDVVMGVAQAGLSQYMNRKYGYTKRGEGKSEKKNDYLPQSIHLRASMVVNIRQSKGIPELADMMKNDSKVKWGNLFSFVHLPLNLALQDDPLDYVRNAKATIDRKKHSFEAICIFYIISFILKIFGSKEKSQVFGQKETLTCAPLGYLYDRLASHATFCFSNVMGPSEEIRIFGNEITYLVTGVYGVPNALIIHFQSYANKMSFGFTFDERAIPDPHQLCDDIEESLKLIKNIVIAGGVP